MTALQPTQQSNAQGQRILAVDDSDMNLLLLQELLAPTLANSGVALDLASSASAGLALACEHRYTLLLLDLHLPDFNGDVFLRRLRSSKDAASRNTPAFALSGEMTTETQANLLRDGFAQVFAKPWEVKRLLHSIQPLLLDQRGASSANTAFDETQALKTVGGDATLMRKLRAMLIVELQTRGPLLRQMLESGDLVALEEHRHRLAGAAGFTGAYRLVQALEQFRVNAVEATLIAVEQAITDILN